MLIFFLLIYYNTIINHILIIYELSNFEPVLGLVSQTKDSGGNRIHDRYANSLAHYPLDTTALKTITVLFIYKYLYSDYLNIVNIFNIRVYTNVT